MKKYFLWAVACQAAAIVLVVATGIWWFAFLGIVGIVLSAKGRSIGAMIPIEWDTDVKQLEKDVTLVFNISLVLVIMGIMAPVVRAAREFAAQRYDIAFAIPILLACNLFVAMNMAMTSQGYLDRKNKKARELLHQLALQADPSKANALLDVLERRGS